MITKVKGFFKKDTVKEVINKIVIPILCTFISVFLVFPLLLEWDFIKSILKIELKGYWCGIVPLYLVIGYYFWKKIIGYLKKCKSSKESMSDKFLFIDSVFFYLFSLIIILVIIILWGKNWCDVSHLYGNTFEISHDVVILARFNGFLFLVGWLYTVIHKRNKHAASKGLNDNVTVISDAPITESSSDLLRRGKFIDDLAKSIENFHLDSTGSFSIGLYAKWGEGKTSVINLLAKKLEDSVEFKNDFIMIKFNPWNYSDKKAITSAFYDVLERAIDNKFIISNFKKLIGKYRKKFSTGISFGGVNLNFNSSEDSMAEMKRDIEDRLKKINKKLFIIIDDIDRLQPEEILLVFKLIRNNFDLKNTIFLLCFDPEIVGQALEKGNIVEGVKYLEKIVNMPIYFPKIERGSIDSYILDKISEFLMREKIAFSLKEIESMLIEYKKLIQKDMSIVFKTLREVKKYLNAIYFNFPSIKNEVNPYDFLLLEIIRTFDNRIFEDIWRHPEFYRSVVSIMANKVDKVGENYNEKSETEAQLDELLKDSSLKELLTSILSELFPGDSEYISLNRISGLHSSDPELSWMKEKRFSDYRYFNKYFTRLVPRGEFSYEESRTIIDRINSCKNQVKLKNEIGKVLLDYEEKKHGLLVLLEDNLKEIKLETFNLIIKIIYENPKAFGEKFYIDYINIPAIMLDLVKENVNIKKENKREMIENALLNTHDLYFAVFTIKILMISSDWSEFQPDIHNLRKMLSKKLEKHFYSEQHDIMNEYDESQWNEVLFNWATNWKNWGESNTKEVKKYVKNTIIKNNPERLSKFLKGIRSVIVFRGVKHYDWNEGIITSFCDYYEISRICYENKENTLLSVQDRDVLKDFYDWLVERNAQGTFDPPIKIYPN